MGRWGRRTGALVVIALAISTGALVHPSEADAYTGAPPWQNPTLWTATENALMSPPAGLSSPGRILVYEAAAEVGAVPASGAIALGMGTVVTAAGALTTGYLLGTLADRWLGISAHFGPEPNSNVSAETHIAQVTWVDSTGGAAGSSWPSNVGVIGEISWRSGLGEGTSGSGQAGLDPFTDYGYAPYDELKVAQASSAAAYGAVCYHEVSYLCSWYVPQSNLGAFITDAVLEPYGSQDVDEAITTWTNDDLPFDSGDPEADAAIESLDSMDEDDQLLFGQAVDPDWDGPDPLTATVVDCEGLTYSACLDELQDVGFVGTIEDAELGIDLADFDVDAGKVVSTNPPAGTTGVAVASTITVNSNPDPMPLELQAQLANETALDYVVRIGLGNPSEYDVTYTEIPPGSEDPMAGPDAPVTVRMPKPGGGTRTVPVPHPGEGSSTKRIPAPGDDPIPVEIFTNPPSMPEVADPPVPGGGGADGCDPWMSTSFDLSPILDADLGDQFPFGVPSWLLEQINALSAGAEAPVLSVHIASLDMEYGPMDFSVFDPYMSTMRTVLSWLAWFGTVWYVGTSLLGFRGSGNPGDAIDDYLGEMF